ncbi:hypothetical protein FIE12Z_6299 [Fusarium flagelliforme]|uniref:Uncharacterized protein n=1 Tax=Fusarium flagelliforme TaxID=2675880 RepID=A0A395MN89_9HYPO|nr:hypothetical protein FIE12Z_6299 [Fusarium flagelliforme]
MAEDQDRVGTTSTKLYDPQSGSMVRDSGGAKLQEQYGQGQTATEETEDTEDAHRPKRQKLIHIPASAEAVRKVFTTNVILEQIYICSANIAITAAKTDDEVMETEPQTVFKRWSKRYLSKEDSTMAVFDPEVVPWLQCGGGYRVGCFAAICLEYVFAFKRLESFQQFVDAAKYRENHPEHNKEPVLAIDLRLFHKDGFERAQDLRRCEPNNEQHGLQLGAHDHLEGWINLYPGSNAAADTEVHTSRLSACRFSSDTLTMRTESLQRFVGVVKRLAVEGGEKPVVAMQLMLFPSDGFKRPARLQGFKCTGLPHGFGLGALMRLFRRVDEGCTNPPKPPNRFVRQATFLPSILGFRVPSEATGPLRQSANVKELEYSLRESTWESAPYSDLHISLLVSAVLANG